VTAEKPGDRFLALTKPEPGVDAKAIADAIDRQTATLEKIADALEKLADRKDG
jgi:hypothetical protein